MPKSCAFHPLDLEIIDLVYEVAWTHISARDPDRDPAEDHQRKALLRKQVFAAAVPGMDFDTLLDKVLANLPETWITHVTLSASPFARSN